MFQSRYRAASHFRLSRYRRVFVSSQCRFNLVIERLLISGALVDLRNPSAGVSFNLVIERLLISGSPSPFFLDRAGQRFQSRYRAASHFRTPSRPCRNNVFMFQSRYRAASHFRSALGGHGGRRLLRFQSRYRAASHFRYWQRPRWEVGCHVSISLSSGFSFQGQKRRHTGLWKKSFNLVIERLLISGTCVLYTDSVLYDSFNLVIERLLISGFWWVCPPLLNHNVSISLSSGFSFQGVMRRWRRHRVCVSISLSSGFSFQVARGYE